MALEPPPPDPRRYEERDEENGEITRVIDVSEEDAPFILGRGGATKRKVARVADAEIELDEHTLTITIVGKREACDKAEDYLNFVRQQRKGTVHIDFETVQREDFSAYAVPEDCIGFVMGRSGQTLRCYEDEWGVPTAALMMHMRREGARPFVSMRGGETSFAS